MYFSNKIEKHYLFYPYFSLQSFIFQFNPLFKNTLNWMLIWVNKDAIIYIYIYIYNENQIKYFKKITNSQ